MERMITKETLSENLYKTLKEDILEQRIKCGQKITLQELKDRFHVSHTPIREALTRLIDDSLMVYYSNVGVKVVEIRHRDVAEIFEFSRDLTALALRNILRGGGRETALQELRRNLSESRAAVEAGNTEVWSACSAEFYELLFRHAGNSKLTGAYAKMSALMRLAYNRYGCREDPRALLAGHEAIYAALRSGGEAAAQAAADSHFARDIIEWSRSLEEE